MFFVLVFKCIRHKVFLFSFALRTVIFLPCRFNLVAQLSMDFSTSCAPGDEIEYISEKFWYSFKIQNDGPDKNV